MVYVPLRLRVGLTAVEHHYVRRDLRCLERYGAQRGKRGIEQEAR